MVQVACNARIKTQQYVQNVTTACICRYRVDSAENVHNYVLLAVPNISVHHISQARLALSTLSLIAGQDAKHVTALTHQFV